LGDPASVAQLGALAVRLRRASSVTTDARISAGLPEHPKTKKLIRKMGQAAGWNLVRLILWAAGNRSDGDLTNLSVEDIEIAADWNGTPGDFVAALVEVRFLDGEDGEYTLHDWSEHNPWAAGAEQRSHKARWNAVCRHHGEAEADRLVPEYASIRTPRNPDSIPSRIASSTPVSTPKDAASITSSNAPSPSPSPSLKTNTPPVGVLPGFVAFWRVWPKSARKEAKGKCLESWRRAGAEALTDQIVAHVERLKRSPGWTKQGGEFIPAPLVYLNNRRWEGAEEDGPSGKWWLAAGFENVYEANNAGCYEHTADQFRDGQKLEAA
jgi:hypothetical protein